MTTYFALDFETLCEDNPEVSYAYWRKDFKIKSCAFAWYNVSNELKTLYLDDIEEIKIAINQVLSLGWIPLVYNAGFELGCILCALPQLKDVWLKSNYVDVMRLVQLYGKVNDDGIAKYGLKIAYPRIMNDPIDSFWEVEIYNWLANAYPDVAKKNLGGYLSLAPKELLEPYNIGDVIATLKLFNKLNNVFQMEQYDWSQDHQLYRFMVEQLTTSKITGVCVDNALLERHISQLSSEIKIIDDTFFQTFENDILKTRELLKQKKQAGYKKKIVTELPEFNINSTQQLEYLFCDVQGIAPTFFTPTRQPSFKKSHLYTWGKGGDILQKRGTVEIALTQCETLLKQSTYDNRWHIELKTVGTTTGRFAGGGGLNVQALSRREKRLMSNIVAEPDYVYVSVDLSAGEPTITTHFTQDKHYKYATFDGVGKAPYYDGEVLMIDDIYLQTASISPVGKDIMRNAFLNDRYDGKTFAEQWLIDPEVIKKKYKVTRALHKIMALGMSYGMGAKKAEKNLADNGFKITLSHAKELHTKYWRLYSGIRAFADQLSLEMKQKGFIYNPFGYRITAEPHNAFNGFIQSSVNGIIALLAMFTLKHYSNATLVTVIHDEIIWKISKNHIEDFQKACQFATDELNSFLQWSVKIRTGFVVGSNFYEAK